MLSKPALHLHNILSKATTAMIVLQPVELIPVAVVFLLIESLLLHLAILILYHPQPSTSSHYVVLLMLLDKHRKPFIPSVDALLSLFFCECIPEHLYVFILRHPGLCEPRLKPALLFLLDICGKPFIAVVMAVMALPPLISFSEVFKVLT